MGRSFDLVVVGAGPAGLAAAIHAAKLGRRVALLEKASRPGVKILVSGGNRCNLTHDCDAAAIARAFGREGGRFLGAALRLLGPRELRAWIESLGVATKVEPGGKVFPVSNRAVDVRDALERELERAGVTFVGSAAVRSVAPPTHGSSARPFVVDTARDEFLAPHVILALGGRSYPKTGTTGDGYAFARALGHTVTETRPALVPLMVATPWVRELSGVTLDDVELTLSITEARDETGATRGSMQSRELDARRGGLLFTHFGLSGPAPMNLGGAVEEAAAQRATASRPALPRSLSLRVNFLPAQTRNAIERALRLAVERQGQRPARAFVAELVPRRLAEALLEQVVGTASDVALAQLSKAKQAKLLDALFATRLDVDGTRGFDFAEVTRGGVELVEVDPATMHSRRVPGLYLCGELLDLDGPIGGYNFTAAFATGALAGRSAASE